LPEKYAKHVKAEILNVFVNNPAGCENCNNWYSGRAVLAEIIKVDPTIYKFILDNSWEDDIRNYLLKKGWLPIYLDWLKRAIDGKMNIHEAIKLDH
jgi:type II secretory ATPase GspE/PulE/Tfp pilus assembly ATPase PilB-like protein